MKGLRRIAGAASGLLLVGCLAFTGMAEGLSPPIQENASVVFDNGGRIFRMDSTGRNRQALEGGELKGHNGPSGLTDPRISPDGNRLVFVLKRADPANGSDVWVARADGSDPVVILKGSKTDHYSTPSWMPDSESLLIGHTRVNGNSYEAGLIQVGADGSGVTDLLRTAPVTARGKDPKGRALTRPVISPDGKSVLFVLASWPVGENIGVDAGRLETLDLESGVRRLIALKSFGGSWSPDGQQIVHARPIQDAEMVCSDFSCFKGARLFITSLDGREETRVIARDDGQFDDFGDERYPEWSPDGSRILFQSERNMHGFTDAYEVYSVEPDGQCLTWLTNGTPASTVPTWAMSDGDSTEPMSCGANGLEPLIELPPPDRSLESLGVFPARYWLGNEINGRLYSGRYDSHPEWGTIGYLKYRDCAFFERKSCGSAIQKYEYSVCVYRGSFARDFFVWRGRAFSKTRGVPSGFGLSNGEYQTFLITGDRFVGSFRMTALFDRTLTGPEVFRAIRPLGSEAAPNGNLKPPRFPATDIRRMKKVVKAVARFGSIDKATESLDMGPNMIKANLRMKRQLSEFGPIRTVSCPKKGVSRLG